MSSPSLPCSSPSVTDQVAPVLRVIERAIREIFRRINEEGLIALLKTALLFAALFALKGNLKHIFGYECPPRGHFFYGNLYIFGPAVFFLCFAFIFSRPFWEFVTGCCRFRCNVQLLASPSSAVDIYLAISAPFLWVACGLSELDYYVCAIYGPEPEGHSYLREEWLGTDPEVRSVNDAKARCHVLVWGILISWAIMSTVVVSFHRCCFRDKAKLIQII